MLERMSSYFLSLSLQKLPNFWDIRQQYHTEVEQLARQKLEKQRADEKAGEARAYVLLWIPGICTA